MSFVEEIIGAHLDASMYAAQRTRAVDPDSPVAREWRQRSIRAEAQASVLMRLHRVDLDEAAALEAGA